MNHNRIIRKLAAVHLVAMVLALLVLLVLSICAPPAQAQVAPTTIGTFTNIPAQVNANMTTNLYSVIDWRQGRSLAVLPNTACTNASTTNITWNFDVTADGTNWSTVALVRTNACNGTTGVRPFFLFAPTEVNSVRQFRLRSVIWGDTANSLFITNVTYSWQN